MVAGLISPFNCAATSADEATVESSSGRPKHNRSSRKRGKMSSNPGHVLASAVDSEIQKFREMQENMQKLQKDLSVVLGQETENEMVLIELDLLNDDMGVFKMLGPVLIPQDLDESRQTVRKRLEFIRSEKKRLQGRISEVENKGNELAQKIQGMQASLQRTTVDAVQAIAAQHGN